MEVIIQFAKRLGLVKRILPIITAISMLFSLVGGLAPTPGALDQVKNVILLIGDGMGENHLKLAKQSLGIELVMETMPLRGQQKTAAFGKAVTDSAAAATALACGVRTLDGSLGVYPYDIYALESYPISLTELAMQRGMKTGVVTTDSTTGATPSGFCAHTSKRGNAADIVAQQISSDIDLIWGSANSKTEQSNVQAGGYTYISTYTELMAINKAQKSFGQFNGNFIWQTENNENTPTLSQMTTKAIDLLDGDEGFFLMVEHDHIDGFSHGNDADKMVISLQEFDNAIAVALDFAQADGNTLVIVTADHETGAIQPEGDTYVYTSGSHSGVDVPLFVYGSSNFIKNGQAIKNKDLSIYVARSLGFSAEEFPRKVPIYWADNQAA
ncbi:MAG: alkaline phosphatase [Clostridiales bacterium]|nr:alkaline phosphatase [Clostridiales bacterium]